MVAATEFEHMDALTEPLPQYTKFDESLPPYTLHDIACLYSRSCKPLTLPRGTPMPLRQFRMGCTINLHLSSSTGELELRQRRVSLLLCSTIQREDLIELLRRWSSLAFQISFTQASTRHDLLILKNTEVGASYMVNAANWHVMQHLLGARGWEVVLECQMPALPTTSLSLKEKAKRLKERAFNR